MVRYITLSLLLVALFSCSYLPEGEQYPPGVLIGEDRDRISIEPEGGAGSATGLVLYPGGLVDPHGYVELASRFALSGSGHRVLIIKMPSNLAVLASRSAGKILSKEEGDQWVIAGHSLGGAMACSMVNSSPGLFGGLILMAAYPPSSADLSDWEGEALSISATEDGIVDRTRYKEAMDLLPASTGFVEINGGNHSGFGSYGEQKGDGEASISREEQHAQVVGFMQVFFYENGFE